MTLALLSTAQHVSDVNTSIFRSLRLFVARSSSHILDHLWLVQFEKLWYVQHTAFRFTMSTHLHFILAVYHYTFIKSVELCQVHVSHFLRLRIILQILTELQNCSTEI